MSKNNSEDELKMIADRIRAGERVVFSPGYHPSDIDALKHPADVATPTAVLERRPDVVVEATEAQHRLRARLKSLADKMQVSELASAAIASGLEAMAMTAPVASAAIASGLEAMMTAPVLNEGQVKFVKGQEACEAVRAAMQVPAMSAAYHETVYLRAMLQKGLKVHGEWCALHLDTLGEVTAAEPGIHATLMNAQEFTAKSLEMLQRAVGKPSEWASAFDRMAHLALEHRCWRIAALAGSAMLAGPFTPIWDNAVEWCVQFWDRDTEVLTVEPARAAAPAAGNAHGEVDGGW